MDPEDDDASDDSLLAEYLRIHNKTHQSGTMNDIERVLKNSPEWSDAIIHYADYWWENEAQQRQWLLWLYNQISENIHTANQ